MVKKKDREKKPADLTPEERQQMADVLTRKIAALMSDFLKKTGCIVSEITIMSHGTPGVNGQASVTQTVNLRYGVPEFMQRPKIEINNG